MELSKNMPDCDVCGTGLDVARTSGAWRWIHDDEWEYEYDHAPATRDLRQTCLDELAQKMTIASRGLSRGGPSRSLTDYLEPLVSAALRVLDLFGADHGYFPAVAHDVPAMVLPKQADVLGLAVPDFIPDSWQEDQP